MTRHLRLLPLLLLLLAATPARAGALQFETLDSPALGRPWPVTLYMPDGHGPGTCLPMLFFLPGLGATTRDMTGTGLALAATADAAIAQGRIPPAIVVVPEMRASWGLDGREKVETALLHDLLPQAARRWHGIPGREGRAIAGISAGGFAALRFALKRPDLFAAAALLSPAIYVPVPPENSGARRSAVFGAPAFDPALWAAANYPSLLAGFLARRVAMPLYIASGADDALGIAAQAGRLRDTWRAAGQQAEWQIVPGGHDYAVWKALLPAVLEFTFRHTARPRPGCDASPVLSRAAAPPPP